MLRCDSLKTLPRKRSCSTYIQYLKTRIEHHTKHDRFKAHHLLCYCPTPSPGVGVHPINIPLNPAYFIKTTARSWSPTPSTPLHGPFRTVRARSRTFYGTMGDAVDFGLQNLEVDM